jgi:hypothetical protein
MRRTATSLLLLLAACGGGSAPTPVRSLAMNSEQAGTLSSRDPQDGEHGSYHAYTVTTTAGQQVRIDVMSSEFDAFVMLRDPRGGVLGSSNDGGDGNDARLTYVLPEDGSYRVVVTSNRPGGVGNYRVRLTSLGGVRVITLGRSVTGQLQPSDQRLPDNFLYQSYMYTARAGETVTIDAMSGEFDPYLMIRDAGGQRIANDDDSGEGRNARLSFTFPYAGPFHILVGTYQGGRAGAYSLSVR